MTRSLMVRYWDQKLRHPGLKVFSLQIINFDYLIRGMAVFLILFMGATNTCANTAVSGIISQDTQWTITNSPYIVIASVLVPEGITLTIEPGVVIKFYGDTALQVNGTLIARGTNQENIVFTSNIDREYWGYLLFADTSANATYDSSGNYINGSILEYCTIEYAKGAEVDHNGAIRINGAHPFVHHCTIQNNQTSGIQAWNLSEKLKIENSSISNNQGAGIGINASGALVNISENTIRYNTSSSTGGGIYMTGLADLIVFNNIIMDNKGVNGGGVSLGHLVTAEISSNIILNNRSHVRGGGISAYYTSGAIYNNLIGNNSAYYYSEDGGSGGGIYSAQSKGLDIHHNAIVENYAGFTGGAILIDIYDETNIFNNSIVGNEADYAAAISYNGKPDKNIQLNTINGNVAKGLPPNFTIEISGFPILEGNNIFDNIGDYEVFNKNSEGRDDIFAEENWWGSDDANDILLKIYDWYDDPAQGFVDFDPWSTVKLTNPPISPPGNIGSTYENGSLKLTWDANTETDVAGYKLYYRQNTGLYKNVIDHPYTAVTDLGDVTSYTLPSLADGKYDVTITAYDSNYSLLHDIPVTLVNENQTTGNESWFAPEQIVKIGPHIEADTVDHNFGNIGTATSSSPKTVTITNAGNKELIIGNISLTGSDTSNFITQFDSISGQLLNPGDTATVGVLFSPPSDGIKKAYLSIPSNDGDQPILKIPLMGISGPQTDLGTLKWEYNGFGFETPAIGSNGTIYAGSSETFSGSMDRKFYAFSPDGTVKWIFRLETGTFGPLGEAKVVIGKDGTIYVASTYGSKFYAINPDGTLKWFFQPEAWKNGEGSTWAPPAIGLDGTIYLGSREKGRSSYFGNTDWGDGKLYALNQDGTVKWAIEIESGLTAPAIASDGTIYIGTAGGCVVRAISPEGTSRWIYTAPGIFWLSSSPAIGPDGTIYIGSFESAGRSLYAITPKGTKKWKFETGSVIYSSPAVGPDGTIYVGSDDNKFYAINPDGTLQWSFETDASVQSSPAIGSNGTIYFGSKDNRFYALNPDGTLKWSYQSDSQITSSPAIGFDGTIYIGSDQDLLAIVSDSNGLVASSWPMFGHDPGHSANSNNTEQVYPIADAGSDQKIDETKQVVLDASASYDPDGNITSYYWFQQAGPEIVLEDPTQAEQIFVVPTVGMETETLLFRLTVTDDSGLESSDTVEIDANNTLASSSSLEFGSIITGNYSAPQEIRIFNSNNQDLIISGVTLTNAKDFTLDVNEGSEALGSLPQIMAPGDSATVTVSFHPTFPGIFNEQLIIRTSDPHNLDTEISLSGWGKQAVNQEDFIVTLGENKLFTAFNVDTIEGTAISDGQNASAFVHVNSYQNGNSEAWSGVRFQVKEGRSGETFSDATISITLSYNLEIDLNALPPEEEGGGSATARIYVWIHNLKQEIDSISFIHDSGHENKNGSITFTHRLGDSPTMTHLYAGQTYEVTAEIQAQAEIYKAYHAFSNVEVTVKDVRIIFDGLDSDGDSMPDHWEDAHGLNSSKDDKFKDLDGDGLSNLDEYNNFTMPNNPDTDADGMNDGWEVNHSFSPLVNDALQDADGDGYVNIVEYNAGTDPNDPNSIPMDIKDSISVLQLLLSMEPSQANVLKIDINNDGKIGLEEALFILQQIGRQ